MLEVIKNESNPCSGGWPNLAKQEFCLPENRNVVIHQSFYWGKGDVNAMPSVWITDNGQTVHVYPDNRERPYQQYELLTLLECWSEREIVLC